jgi:hypothetical protein
VLIIVPVEAGFFLARDLDDPPSRVVADGFPFPFPVCAFPANMLALVQRFFETGRRRARVGFEIPIDLALVTPRNATTRIMLEPIPAEEEEHASDRHDMLMAQEGEPFL